MILSEQRKELIAEEGHLLIMGGPGAGKTTVALLKANSLISKNTIEKGQKILFLSFARSTISRIQEQAKGLINNERKDHIEINTYHGFIWKLLQNFGYLLCQQKEIKLLTPPMASAVLAEYEENHRSQVLEKLFWDDGLLSFEIFGSTTARLFAESDRILRLYTSIYPTIIVDEFQDTDIHEWTIIKLLGKYSTIVALADPEQRIYDFRGASVSRIPEFIEHFNPKVFDFEQQNNRSSGKDIIKFGNDLLLSLNKGQIYTDVAVIKYAFNKNEPNKMLKISIFNGIKRLKTSIGVGWSIAILVRSKKMMLTVSAYLSSVTSLPAINHEVAIDPNGPSLAGIVIAALMEPAEDRTNRFFETSTNIINHIKGRSGDKMSSTSLQFTNAIENYLKTGKLTGKNRLKFIDELSLIIEKRETIIFVGIPEIDWLSIRSLFQNCENTYLKTVYEDAKYLRLLNKGAILSERLTDKWRNSQTYAGAKVTIQDALLQEHFIATQSSYKGIHIMTLHKSKGKEFDEVFIWEDYYNPIVRRDANEKELIESRYLLRVGVTRAREKTTLLTVASQPCILL